MLCKFRGVAMTLGAARKLAHPRPAPPQASLDNATDAPRDLRVASRAAARLPPP